MNEYITTSIEIDDVKLVYHIAGDNDKPTLLFLHAWGIGINWLQPIVVSLSKHFHVIAPEHPGLLRSSTLTDNSFESYAAFYKKILNKIEITTPVIMVGSSFGGGIASVIAKLYPEMVQKLILVDSVLPVEFPQTFLVSSIHRVNKLLVTSSFVPMLIKKFIVWRALGTSRTLLTTQEMQKKITLLSTARHLNVDYNTINIPATFIWGRSDRFVHPIRYARAIVKTNPQIRLYEYPGSVPTLYKKPERVVTLIIKVTGINT